MTSDRQLAAATGLLNATIPFESIPEPRKKTFERFDEYELMPYNLSEEECGGLRDIVVGALELHTLMAQIGRGREYKPVDTNERGQAVPHATLVFASGKNATSFLGVDLFLFEIPVAYRVMGVVNEEFLAPHLQSQSTGRERGRRSGQAHFAVRVAYERRVVAALRGHIVQRNGNQYHSRDILLLKTLLAMLGEREGGGVGSSACASTCSSSATGGAGVALNTSESAPANRFPCIELVSRLINKPGDSNRERFQAMMMAAAEVYVDVRVVEQQTMAERRRLFFHGRADGTIERNDVPQTLQSAIPPVLASVAA